MFNLSDLDKEYTETKSPSRDELPDGTYQVVIDKFELANTKGTPPKPMLKWEFKVVSGDHAGRKLFKNSVLQSGKSLEFIKADLLATGFTDTISALEDPTKRMKLLDIGLEVKKVTKGQDDQGRPQSNIYINRKIDVAASATDTPF